MERNFAAAIIGIIVAIILIVTGLSVIISLAYGKTSENDCKADGEKESASPSATD